MTARSRILWGILGAAAAGVVIGLLIAPEKGSDMRKRIKRSTGTWVNNLGQLFSKTREHLEGAQQHLEKAATSVGSKLSG